MQNLTKSFLLTSLLAAGVLITQSSRAEESFQADPPRWTIEDTTPQARYQTSMKEAEAAFREAQAECRRMSGAERNACMRDAREHHQADLMDARKRLSE
jgi:hypothetical protein